MQPTQDTHSAVESFFKQTTVLLNGVFEAMQTRSEKSTPQSPLAGVTDAEIDNLFK